jgi:DNA-binding GntR family transcriptional regulator
MYQETSACPVSGLAAQRLGVEEGSAGMQIIRRYFSKDARKLLVSSTVYPAGRYSFSFAITLPRAD